MAKHLELTNEELHNPFSWIFDNKSQFHVYVPLNESDINKLALIKETSEIFRLVQVNPLFKWECIFEPYLSKDLFLQNKAINKIEYDSNGNKLKVYYEDKFTQLYTYENNLVVNTKIYYKSYLVEEWNFTYENNLLKSSTKLT